MLLLLLLLLLLSKVPAGPVPGVGLVQYKYRAIHHAQQPVIASQDGRAMLLLLSHVCQVSSELTSSYCCVLFLTALLSQIT
jgi:hypothetical protein